MKIKNSEKIRLERIDNLPTGQVIVYNNNYYIIIDKGYIVNLSDGKARDYNPADFAIPVDAELTIL